jgi:SAM-dependent methyltransferase
MSGGDQGVMRGAPSAEHDSLEALYQVRFSTAEARAKQRIWQILCRDFFQRYVDPQWTMLDLGAGYCEFINNINCARKIAVDLNPEVARFAQPGVEVLLARSDDLRMLDDGSIDGVFASNFFEHLPNTDIFLATLRESARVLRPGGRLLILQPNIQYVGHEYWDFVDHHLPLTHRTLIEALNLVGLRPVEVVPRFLPYSTKSRLPQAPWLIRLYLRVRLAWPILGKQAWIVAEKSSAR